MDDSPSSDESVISSAAFRSAASLSTHRRRHCPARNVTSIAAAPEPLRRTPNSFCSPTESTQHWSSVLLFCSIVSAQPPVPNISRPSRGSPTACPSALFQYSLASCVEKIGHNRGTFLPRFIVENSSRMEESLQMGARMHPLCFSTYSCPPIPHSLLPVSSHGERPKASLISQWHIPSSHILCC